MSDHDGEKELVLGNKQLLTIFFVATLLCGVFFAMGYVVGGNSAKASLTSPNGDTSPTTEGQRPEPSVGAQDTMPPPTNEVVPSPEPKFAENTGTSGAQPVPQIAVAPPPPP